MCVHLQKQRHQRESSQSSNAAQKSIGHSEGETNLATADDSDYYTPEDPHTTILSPLCPEKVRPNQKSYQYFCTQIA